MTSRHSIKCEIFSFIFFVLQQRFMLKTPKWILFNIWLQTFVHYGVWDFPKKNKKQKLWPSHSPRMTWPSQAIPVKLVIMLARPFSTFACVPFVRSLLSALQIVSKAVLKICCNETTGWLTKYEPVRVSQSPTAQTESQFLCVRPKIISLYADFLFCAQLGSPMNKTPCERWTRVLYSEVTCCSSFPTP